MSDMPIVTMSEAEPSISLIGYECKFTVESRGGVGGDFQRNTGGTTSEKRVTFDGYASPELYAALIDAMGKAVG